MSKGKQVLNMFFVCYHNLGNYALIIKHINPIMFDAIDDKPKAYPEEFIMYKHEPVGRGLYIDYHINHEARAGVCVIKL